VNSFQQDLGDRIAGQADAAQIAAAE